MNNKNLTLGSLFDGSGGFPLAGLYSGIKPVWASEIEPFPIRVTTKRFPWMKHYGDVSSMKGNKVDPVDIITGGSPCQDLSFAGKRAGLEGKRSNLFYQIIRIIKEMREKTNGKYPKYFVWENVPGAFSSNKGDDFRCVLEEICRITDETADVPLADKWTNAGEILDEEYNYSVAWRVLDAQYWGVPQRRKRIFLIADFTGLNASKILFESEGLSGYSAKNFNAWKNSPKSFEKRLKRTVRDYELDRYNTSSDDIAVKLGTTYGVPTSKNGVAVIKNMGNQPKDISQGKPSALEDNLNHLPIVKNEFWLFENHGQDARYSGPLNVSPTVSATYGTGGITQPFVVRKIKILDDNGCNSGYQNGVVKPNYTVRRLTPLECARLQGFPDWWCSDLKTENPTENEIAFWIEVFETHRKIVTRGQKPKTKKQIKKWLQNPCTDRAEYKMWGNGVALPCVAFVLMGISWAENKTK